MLSHRVDRGKKERAERAKEHILGMSSSGSSVEKAPQAQAKIAHGNSPANNQASNGTLASTNVPNNDGSITGESSGHATLAGVSPAAAGAQEQKISINSNSPPQQPFALV